MADVTVANTSPGIAGKTLACHDADGTTTGIWTWATPLALKSGPSGSQTWRVSVTGSGNLNILADGTGSGLSLNTAGDISEKSRTTPLGHWIEFAPSLTANLGTVTLVALYACRYMLVGKTVTFNVLFDVTTDANPSVISLVLPAGMSAFGQNIGAIVIGKASVGSSGVISTQPGGTALLFTVDVFTAGVFAAGTWRVGGSFSFPIN